MRIPALFLILAFAGSAHCQFELVRKGNPWESIIAETACLNGTKDTLTLVRAGERTSLPLDSARMLAYRERKSWWPYLAASGLAGASAYTALHFTARDDAMYTAEGKARFGGVMAGLTVLLLGSLLKEPFETRIFINPIFGIDDAAALVACGF